MAGEVRVRGFKVVELVHPPDTEVKVLNPLPPSWSIKQLEASLRVLCVVHIFHICALGGLQVEVTWDETLYYALIHVRQ